MAWVTPTSRSDGYTVPASEWNQNAVDNPIALRAGGVAIASQAANDVLYASSSSQWARLAAGTAGQVLQTNGSGAAPSFVNVGRLAEQTTTATGAQNNFDITVANATVLRCTGAAPSFSGFTVAGGAPVTGQQIVLECLGTTLKVTHQDTNSTAENRIICESANGQIVGASGRILLIYDGTTSRWRATLIDPGTPITPTFSAGDYTPDSGTWTVASGDVTSMVYQQRGKTVWVAWTLATTTVASSPTYLQIAIPGGFTATKTVYGFARGVDNSAVTAAFCRVNASGTVIQNGRNDAATWANATDATSIFGQLTFEVN